MAMQNISLKILITHTMLKYHKEIQNINKNKVLTLNNIIIDYSLLW